MDFGKIINLALMVMVVIVTVLFIVPAFSTIYAQLFKSDLDGLKMSDRLHIENNFNEIVNNFDSCMSINDSNCYCDGLPDFPDGTLPKESEIVIETSANGTKFTLRYNEKDARTRNTSVNFGAFYYSGGWKEDRDIKEQLEKENKTTLSFKLIRMTYAKIKIPFGKKGEVYYPYFEVKGFLKRDAPLASSLLYKSSDKAGFVTIAGASMIEEVEAQEKALGDIASCAPNKAEAKEELSKLVSVLKSKKEGAYKVNLPVNYEILLGGKILFLEYNKKKIQETSLDDCICNNCTFSETLEGKKEINITLENKIPCVKG